MNDLARIQTQPSGNIPVVKVTDDEASIARDLSQRIAKGDSDAEVAAYRQYSRRMLLTTRRYAKCEADAEDWLSIAWITALPKLRAGELVKSESLPAFLVSLARYVALGELRKRSWLQTTDDNDYLEQSMVSTDTGFDTVLKQQRLAQTEELIQALPVRRDRDLIRRRFLENCSVSTLCDEYEVDRLQLSRLLHRAQKRLLATSAACRNLSGAIA